MIDLDSVRPYDLYNGTYVINVTSHPIAFGLVGDRGIVSVNVPPSGIVIRAEVNERFVGRALGGAAFVEPEFVPDPDQVAVLRELKDRWPGVIILGSKLAAEAYPWLVAAACPLEIAPNYKDPNRFNLFTASRMAAAF